MKVTGIIAEYNPFHKGHEYQIKKARELTDADYVIVVMSGDFTQRGAPALLDKYTRARMALACGADLVLELPVRYACASAEFFAGGAVSVLDGLRVVDYLFAGNPEILKKSPHPPMPSSPPKKTMNTADASDKTKKKASPTPPPGPKPLI